MPDGRFCLRRRRLSHASADTTVRYHTDIQSSSLVPAGTLDNALSGIRDIVIQIKGNKTHSTLGNLVSIKDLSSQDMTLVDAAHKRFATAPVSLYVEQLKTAVQAVPNLGSQRSCLFKDQP